MNNELNRRDEISIALSTEAQNKILDCTCHKRSPLLCPVHAYYTARMTEEEEDCRGYSRAVFESWRRS